MHRSVIAFLIICIAPAALAQSLLPQKKLAAPVARPQSHVPNPVASAGSRPSLCVVSLVGTKFEVETIGLTVFGNSLAPADITSWSLDDLIVRKVSAIAGSRFAVHRLSLNKTGLAAYQAPRKSVLQGGPLFRDANKEFVDLLKDAAASGSRCDLFLAIRRSISPYGNTNQHLEGLGILNHDTGILSAQFLFSILDASVYDGKTYEQRSIKFVRTGPAIDLGEALTGPGIHGLYRRVDKSWLPNPPQAAAQNARLREATWALIEPGLANTIPPMLAPE